MPGSPLSAPKTAALSGGEDGHGGDGTRGGEGTPGRGGDNSDLLQPVEDGDEEPHVWQALVVEVTDPLHQLGRGGHCQEGGDTSPRVTCHPTASPSSPTFVRQAVQAARHQRLGSLGTVLHQQQQLGRVHPHPTDLRESHRWCHQATVSPQRPPLHPAAGLTGCSMTRRTVRLMSAMASV